ncbi:MAG: MTH938/NDUFAF3 family protein [Brachymonas sp.]|nr:MTH938/NDUFAF3 family protein [Brachymonas sp.]
MQIDAEPFQSHAITAYGPEGVTVNGQLHRGCLLLSSEGLLQPWQVNDANGSIAAEDLAAILEHAAEQAAPYELLLLGTGRTAFFPPAPWIAPFVRQGLPLEVMGTAAACRTYNIVAGEGRKVLAALWQPF